ncbi:hypothetical protein QUV83_13980 [Cellulomonas cellasea]|uniref:hypothetical protein n=1 Tax=Cellulomonas cellasea TaxID=43670 RepID=UPI0025A46C08|nr:hypothetical protein [Cellulomonas cellasea]MDM8085881.1 hypothetical protein [Cellulomonas cellasea]
MLTLTPGVMGGPVLGLPQGLDVLALAGAWFPHAAWDRAPVTAAQAQRSARPMAGARFRGLAQAAAAEPGILRIADDAVLSGPHPLEAPSPARGSRAGSWLLDGYEVEHSGALPPPEVTRWLTAAARHAGGAVVAPDRSTISTYDAAMVVDLTLWSAVALPVDALVRLVRPRLPGARVSMSAPPSPASGSTPVPAVGGSAVAPYEMVARFEYDGEVRLRFGRAPGPRVLDSIGWRDHGPFAYAVRWAPPDPEELESPHPTTSHLIARSRVAPVVARVVGALMPAVGGVVVDDGGFLVGPAELGVRARGLER